MSDSEIPSQNTSKNRPLSLTESAEAVKGALKGCHAELDKLQRRLRGTLPEGRELRGDGEKNTPHNHALYLALRLESCAETLRKAANPSGE
ncbi:MAG: hypothetical protein ABEL04_06520 [Salinibacter sp.]|uniref:hypothetical protein n=1 Tax=Salinibacter sp. TaxID=2065818 RepID=UPI0035D48949